MYVFAAILWPTRYFSVIRRSLHLYDVTVKLTYMYICMCHALLHVYLHFVLFRTIYYYQVAV
jgi:hypothetical protein